MNKLSQEEANELINALKRKIEEKIFYFPHEKGRLEFNVLSDDEKEFVVNIQRKGIRNILSDHIYIFIQKNTVMKQFHLT